MKKKNGLDIRHLNIRDKNDKPINTFTDLQKANLDATCDCGIDCCKGELVLKDKGTNQPVRISVTDGELSVGQSEVGAAAYKVYTALLSQSGTNAPTAVVLENTLGGTVVWARSSAGTYTATLANSFPQNKTYYQITLYADVGGLYDNQVVELRWQSNSAMVLSIFDKVSGNGVDSLLVSFPIEIRVYP